MSRKPGWRGALARGGRKRGMYEDRIDVAPLWIRPLILAMNLTPRVLAALFGDGSFVKLVVAVLDSVFYSFVMIPFAVRSYLRRQYGKRVWRNVEYGPRERNRLDVYLPDPELGHGRFGKSVILFVHGGAWYWGSKTYHALMQEVSFPDSTVVCINYSLHPHAEVETMVHDISLAIKWTHDTICKQDPAWWLTDSPGGAPLILVGHSAGAHLCALTLSLRCGLGPPLPNPT
eukprot:CAMPEP_0173409566 /NCGR_PEP_ID=MMETSP1356-20130122/72451_1 /TAXON_ID=77927 ORGANISM="Hemiselmis virescens, Strain PCC157" /NCGR_SAMPLE_ID=MMETSP1356 /ASSEMBLY_ACC=CAM_ASM_000847 /LENGTH=230 /DNA_ID=CAMNT_0014371059 /DNA_START=131 /DNA_END=819 /DNA_ORIENTATION=-